MKQKAIVQAIRRKLLALVTGRESLRKLETESSKLKGKAYIPEEPESDPSLSDTSLSESDSSNDSKYRKYKNKEHNKKKNSWKCTKQDSSDSSSSDSGSSEESDYICKRFKNKRY